MMPKGGKKTTTAITITLILLVLALVTGLAGYWFWPSQTPAPVIMEDDYSGDANVLFFANPSRAVFTIHNKQVGDAFQLPQKEQALFVTGTYTGTDDKPTGLFVADGQVINRNALAWDGVLVVNDQHQAQIFNRRKITIGNQSFDLTDNEAQRQFVETAESSKLSVLQSHLLVSDGTVDVRERADAKKFRRRLLIQNIRGTWILFDSLQDRITFFEAANLAKENYQAVFALNLDMGSYDYCQRIEHNEPAKNCGQTLDTGKLTNILELRAGK